MAIETLPSVEVTKEDWVYISTGKVLLFATKGTVQFSFSDAKPDVETGNIAFELDDGGAFENGIGGTIWGKLANTGVALVRITSLV